MTALRNYLGRTNSSLYICRNIAKLGVLILSLCAVALNARAVEISDPANLLSARAQSRGGATSASTLYHDALFQNPASSVFTNRYAVTAGYLGTGNALAASIVDTQSGPVGGGVYYVRRDLNNASNLSSSSLGNYTRTEEHMGLALMGKLNNTFGVGTSVRYTYRRTDDSAVDSALHSSSAWNFDVGARYLVSPFLTLGFVAQNLMTDNMGVYPKRVTAALEYMPIPGIFVSGQMFKVDNKNLKSGFTLPNPDKNVGWSAGAEYVFSMSASLRAGYISNPTWNQTLATAGIGYISQEFSVDYALQKGVGTTQELSHLVTVTGYF